MLAFINPLFLLAGSAIVAPILIHLLLRNRPQRKILPTMRFLPSTAQQSVAMHKLKNWALLALRIAAVLLIACAFARPYIERPQAAPTQDEVNEAAVFAVDASFSMRANDHWRTAVDRASALNRALDADSRRGVVVFDRAPQVACANTGDAQAVEDALRRASPGYGATDLIAGIRAAADLALTMNAKIRNVYLLSDFQRAGFKQIAGTIDIPEGVTLIPTPIGEGDLSPNAAVIALREGAEPDAEHRKMIVQVALFGGKSMGGTLEMVSGDKVLDSKKIQLSGADRLVEEFALPLRPDAEYTVTARMKCSDALADDNTLTVVVPAHATLPLLVCTSSEVVAMGGAESKGEALPGANPYLKAAVAAFSGKVTASWLAPAQIDTMNASEYKAAVVNAPESLSPKGRDALKSFVRQGGVLVLFPGGQDASVVQEIAGVQTDGWESLKEADQFRLVTYVASDSALSSLGESGAAALGYPKVFQYLKFSEPSTVQSASDEAATHAVVRLDDGWPFLVSKKLGQGTVYAFAAPLNPKYSDLVLRAGFPPFLFQLLDQGVERVRPRRSYLVGDTLTDAADDAVLTGPDRRVVETELVRRPLQNPGVYTLRQGGVERTFAVRIDPEESDLTRLDAQRIEALAHGGTPGGAVLAAATAAEVAREDAEPDAKQPVWWYLMAGALACLGVETLIASRTSR